MIDKDKRRFINSSWDQRCAYCGAEATSLDHIIPKNKGGTNSVSNLVPSCSRCNNSKANLDLVQWYLSQHSFDRSRLERIITWILVQKWSQKAKQNLYYPYPANTNFLDGCDW